MSSLSKRTDRRTVALLAAILGGSGVLHFAKPAPYDRLIPRELPGAARTWTYLSGAAELACATAVAVPRTRRLGALLAALLFVAVFPGNVTMAIAYQRAGKPLSAKLIAYGRLPLQWPLVLWALRVRHGSR
jgi:uncharacterized membrane protein